MSAHLNLFSPLNYKSTGHRSLSELEPEELFAKALRSVEIAITIIRDQNLWKKLGSYQPIYEKPMDSHEADRAQYLNSGFFVFEICQKWKGEPRFAGELQMREEEVKQRLAPKDQRSLFHPELAESQYFIRFPG